MKIDINNYEAFFLDYHEGKLGPHEVAELMLFLQENPELKEVFDEFESISLNEMENAEVVFEGKESLKKNIIIDKSNYEQYFVSAMEGDLNSMEKEQLRMFLHANPNLRYDLELYYKTKLSPDLSIVYENKEELKHKKGRVIALWYYAAAAAAALLIGMFFLIGQPSEKDKVADNTDTTTKKTIHPNNINVPNPVANNNQQESNSTSPSKNEVASVKKHNRNGHSNSTAKNNDPQQLPSPNVPDEMQSPVQQPVIANNNKQNAIDSIRKDQYIASNTPKHEEINERYDEPSEALSMGMSSNDYTLKDIAVSKLKSTLLEGEAGVDEAPNKLTGWDLVAVALKGFRKLSGKPTEVEKKYNEDGEVIAYNVSAGGFGISRSRGK